MRQALFDCNSLFSAVCFDTLRFAELIKPEHKCPFYMLECLMARLSAPTLVNQFQQVAIASAEKT